ncbi:hypothetical protein C8A00DRAFT_39369 [Chaetomidium leptoderma]|uniref:Uncharacterized protein n=1 Tax=Chaetomidium leptoderma TaxID=669021 RepID=A0AAN7A1Y4_9PEZI|nr:hypothetical protein C8A00DRAFT_39369 [Chaetomidium leptoderma]
MAGTMEPLIPSTPSPGPISRARTPPAPQHGYSDAYEPYTSRKSTRIAQRVANRTPSPEPSSRHPSHHQESSLGSPKSTKKRYPSTMATPALSPQKKRMPPMDSSRRASGTLTAEGTANAAVVLGLSPPSLKPDLLSTRPGAVAGAGMLITPAKTPKKSPNEKVKAKVKSVARNLFHSDDEEVMPSPRKMRTETHNPDSFYIGEAAASSFQIFTDSHERVPEIDNSTDNPFFVGQNAAPPEPSRRRSKRHTISIPGEGKVSVDEAIRREDGMLIVFRGKKQFRKFTEMDEPSSREGLDEGEGGLESAVESPTKRHFTRSSIKPRLLFPTANSDESRDLDDDEEAATDIEDHVLAGMEADKPETPMDLIDKAPGTPEAPRYAPASPPTTARTTRFASKKGADATPKPKPPAKRSPFDSWRRVKGGAPSTGHKRSGDDLSAAAPKRPRA